MVGRPRVVVTVDDVAELEVLAASARRGEADRARGVLLSAHGWTSGEIARAFGVTPDSVRRWRTWRNRLVCAGFMAEGVDGLRAHPQAGAAPIKSGAALALAREVLSAGGGSAELDLAAVASRTGSAQRAFDLQSAAQQGA